MTDEDAIKILEQQRYFWSYDGPIDKCPPATLRKDLVEALDIAIKHIMDDGLSPKAAKAGEELEHLREQLKRL